MFACLRAFELQRLSGRLLYGGWRELRGTVTATSGGVSSDRALHVVKGPSFLSGEHQPACHSPSALGSAGALELVLNMPLTD